MTKSTTTIALLALALIIVLASYMPERRTKDSPANVPPADPARSEQAWDAGEAGVVALPAPLPDRESAAPAGAGMRALHTLPAETIPGFRKETASTDFSIYLVFMGLGDPGWVTAPDGEIHDRSLLDSVKREYGLSDEELGKVLRYSRSALQSDREHQLSDHRAICAKRSQYHSYGEFGEALNRHARAARDFQEALGRDAETELGPVLFAKISTRVRSKPPTELVEADFPTLFMHRNEGLATEIERFCSYGK